MGGCLNGEPLDSATLLSKSTLHRAQSIIVVNRRRLIDLFMINAFIHIIYLFRSKSSRPCQALLVVKRYCVLYRLTVQSLAFSSTSNYT